MNVIRLDKRWLGQIGFLIDEHLGGIAFPFRGNFGDDHFIQIRQYILPGQNNNGPGTRLAAEINHPYITTIH
jgi:hypothetical protein